MSDTTEGHQMSDLSEWKTMNKSLLSSCLGEIMAIKMKNRYFIQALLQNSSWFSPHMHFPDEDASKFKTEKVIRANFKLDLLFICIQCKYINYTPKLWSKLHWVCTYLLHKEETDKILAKQHMLYLCSMSEHVGEWGELRILELCHCLLMVEERSKSSVCESWCHLPLWSLEVTLLSKNFWFGVRTLTAVANS